MSTVVHCQHFVIKVFYDKFQVILLENELSTSYSKNKIFYSNLQKLIWDMTLTVFFFMFLPSAIYTLSTLSDE